MQAAFLGQWSCGYLRRGFFVDAEPDVLKGDSMPQLKWTAADEEGLVQFLVGEKSFNEDRVRKAVQRVNAAKSKSTQGVHMQLRVLVPSTH